MKQLTPEQKKQRIETLVKLLGLGVVGFLVAPVIFMTIQGIIGLAIAAAISFVVINFIPWFAMKVANWRLKALKYEASQNPIETLENQYQERVNALAEFRENIKVFHAEVQNFYAELEEHRSKYPDQVVKFEEQFVKMKRLLQTRGEKYKLAQKKLKDFEDLIERKRSEWKIAQAAAKMTRASGVGEDFMSKLMADTAVDSVQLGLNTAFAELEVSLLDEQPAMVASPVEAVALPAGQPVAALTDRTGPPMLDLDFNIEEVDVVPRKK